MTKLFFIIAFLVGFGSYPSDKGKVIIDITELETREGKILLSVYNSEDGFPGKEDKAFKNMFVEIGATSCRTQIELPAGTYAIAVVHDINDNNKADTNFLGIPKEPLGMSNYPEMARPKFDKAKFNVKAGETIYLEIPVDTIF